MATNTISQIKISVLDLAIVRDGGNAADTFKNSLDLAQKVEKWGYNRFWLAEHHNMQGIASTATVVLIGHIAAGTSASKVRACAPTDSKAATAMIRTVDNTFMRIPLYVFLSTPAHVLDHSSKKGEGCQHNCQTQNAKFY